MFDIGWSEMAVILLVALVVIGPKDLPRLARTLGQWVAKGRAMAREFQRSLEDMAREAELDDVKQQIEKAGRININKSIRDTIDPTGELDKAFEPPKTTAGSKRTTSKAGSKAVAKPASSAAASKPASSAANGGAKPEPEPAAAEAKPAAPEPHTESKTESKSEAVPAEPR